MGGLKDRPWVIEYMYTNSTGECSWCYWEAHRFRADACVELAKLAFDNFEWPLRIRNSKTGEIL